MHEFTVSAKTNLAFGNRLIPETRESVSCAPLVRKSLLVLHDSKRLKSKSRLENTHSTVLFERLLDFSLTQTAQRSHNDFA